MSRNLNCPCLCHGSNGNRIGDNMFSCKNCYAAMHMGNLPRLAHEQEPEKRKQRKPKPKFEFEQKTLGTATLKVPVASKGKGA